MAKIQFTHTYEHIISMENLLEAWQDFIKGKRQRADVQFFERNLMANLLSLHNDLKAFSYQHSAYSAFRISDPKPRHIHKATVRDRVLHRAIYRQLYPHFDRAFAADSFSCRLNKGTHKAIKRFGECGRKVSRNNAKTCWVLKCDIKKFFASVHQPTLLKILIEYIPDNNIIWLIEKVLVSFNSGEQNRGLPLGNLTSQLFANVYMNVFDQCVKHKLKIKYYCRYADDFVVLYRNSEIPATLPPGDEGVCDVVGGADTSRFATRPDTPRLAAGSSSSTECQYLVNLIPNIRNYLDDKLKLTLHPDKVFIQTLGSGVYYLGWVNFPDHHILRTATKKRMLKALANNPSPETLASYLGLLKHGNSWKLRQIVENLGKSN